MKKLILFLLSFFFLFFFNQAQQTPSSVNATNNVDDDDNIFGQDDDDIVCVDLADFHYEIILGVTSFPEQGDCSEREEAEIANFLQKSINKQLRAIPGTINTQNKVCDSPINTRRRLTESKNGSLPFYHEWRKKKQPSDSTMMSLQSVDDPMPWENDDKMFHRRLLRSFIYVGGGRCRYCFDDNNDGRALATIKDLPTPTQKELPLLSDEKKKNDERNLLFFSLLNLNRPLDKVADILLCKDVGARKRFYFEPGGKKTYQETINWINPKSTHLPMKIPRYPYGSGKYRIQNWTLIGPYLPGEKFGIQVDMKRAVNLKDDNDRIYIKTTYDEGEKIAKVPVKQGIIRFNMFAFDIPDDLPSDLLADDSLIVFLNGIKLDFKLLMSHPDAKGRTKRHVTTMEGYSLAGIKWRVIRWTRSRQTMYPNNNFAYGPESEAEYLFLITAPVVVFDHKNQFDLDFLIKPTAEAKQYAIRNLRVDFHGARCEVTGMENSPFEDFKSVVESRLFHKLGIDLAQEFQGKQGHCLFEKIPVVNVNLVEKETWRESNPQCGK